MNYHKTVTAFVFLPTILACIGCSPIYITKAGYYQSRLLLARENTVNLLAESDLDSKLRQRLVLSQEILDYAKSIGLNTGERYSAVSNYKFPALWVVTAAPKFSLNAYTWWFPIIGEVPYKGYFNKEDAISEAITLQESGLDVSIRTASAFSTLGWFNDPITTSLLDQEELEFIITIFHELFHATIWVNERVEFNESFANAFGYWTALEFIQLKHPDLLSESQNRLKRQCKISKIISETKNQLEQIYNSDLNELNKETSKNEIYTKFQATLKIKPAQISNGNFEKSDNNAYFIGLTPYYNQFIAALEFFITFDSSKNGIRELKSLIEDKNSETLTETLEEKIKKTIIGKADRNKRLILENLCELSTPS